MVKKRSSNNNKKNKGNRQQQQQRSKLATTTTAAPPPIDGGNGDEPLVTVENVTEKVRAAEKLQQQQQQLAESNTAAGGATGDGRLSQQHATTDASSIATPSTAQLQQPLFSAASIDPNHAVGTTTNPQQQQQQTNLPGNFTWNGSGTGGITGNGSGTTSALIPTAPPVVCPPNLSNAESTAAIANAATINTNTMSSYQQQIQHVQQQAAAMATATKLLQQQQQQQNQQQILNANTNTAAAAAAVSLPILTNNNNNNNGSMSPVDAASAQAAYTTAATNGQYYGNSHVAGANTVLPPGQPLQPQPQPQQLTLQQQQQLLQHQQQQQQQQQACHENLEDLRWLREAELHQTRFGEPYLQLEYQETDEIVQLLGHFMATVTPRRQLLDTIHSIWQQTVLSTMLQSSSVWNKPNVTAQDQRYMKDCLKMSRYKINFIMHHVMARILLHPDWDHGYALHICCQTLELLPRLVESCPHHATNVRATILHFEGKEFLATVACETWDTLYDCGIAIHTILPRIIPILRKLAMLDILDKDWNMLGGWEDILKGLEAKCCSGTSHPVSMMPSPTLPSLQQQQLLATPPAPAPTIDACPSTPLPPSASVQPQQQPDTPTPLQNPTVPSMQLPTPPTILISRLDSDAALHETTTILRNARNSMQCKFFSVRFMRYTDDQAPQRWRYFPKCSAPACAHLETPGFPHPHRCTSCWYFHYCSPACMEYCDNIMGLHPKFCKDTPAAKAAHCQYETEQYLGWNLMNNSVSAGGGGGGGTIRNSNGNSTSNTDSTKTSTTAFNETTMNSSHNILLICKACGSFDESTKLQQPATQNANNTITTTSTQFQRCSACRTTVYCGKQCQEWDWKIGGHRLECRNVTTTSSLLSTLSLSAASNATASNGNVDSHNTVAVSKAANDTTNKKKKKKNNTAKTATTSTSSTSTTTVSVTTEINTEEVVTTTETNAEKVVAAADDNSTNDNTTKK